MLPEYLRNIVWCWSMSLKINTFYVAESVGFIREFVPDNFIDLTVTSPPYDGLRKYKGYSFDFEPMADELYRVTKDGGVVVWIVNDATIDGDETGTSFRQALYFKEVGFKLHDTMIWKKTNPFNFGSNYCYTQSFEYMFVFSKGKPKAINLIRDRPLKNAGKQFKQTRRSNNDFMEYDERIVTLKDVGRRFNVWEMPVQSVKGHPAPFPEQLVNDHIITWSNPGDIVLDPMCGSGTTCKMAWINKRNFIGIDISEEYIKEICIPRLESVGWKEH